MQTNPTKHDFENGASYNYPNKTARGMTETNNRRGKDNARPVDPNGIGYRIAGYGTLDTLRSNGQRRHYLKQKSVKCPCCSGRIVVYGLSNYGKIALKHLRIRRMARLWAKDLS